MIGEKEKTYNFTLIQVNAQRNGQATQSTKPNQTEPKIQHKWLWESETKQNEEEKKLGRNIIRLDRIPMTIASSSADFI